MPDEPGGWPRRSTPSSLPPTAAVGQDWQHAVHEVRAPTDPFALTLARRIDAARRLDARATLTELRLVAVKVARPRPVGRLRSGESIVSGIGKRPVAADTLFLDVLNLEGDG